MTPVQTILQKFNSMTPPDFDDWLLDNKHELIRLELCALEDSYMAGYDARDENIDPNARDKFNDFYAGYFND